MDERVLTRGLVLAVCYRHGDRAEACVANQGFWDLSGAEADKALAAKRADKEIEIVEGDGAWQTRTVRLVPVVVVKARGKVQNVRTYTDEAWLGQQSRAHFVSNISVAARAYADDAEVEIVSIDGGPDMVRRVS